MIKQTLGILVLSAFASPANAATVEAHPLKVARIAIDAAGHANMSFTSNGSYYRCAASESIFLRLPDGQHSDRIIALVTAALLSGKTIKVAYNDAVLNDSKCVIEWVSLYAE